MMQDRGESLLNRKAKGDFAGHEEAMERARKQGRTDPTQNLWGASEKEQERGIPGKGAVPAPRRSFDPDQDLVVKKPITGADFAKLVEDSSAGLAGRFGRS